jgi:hypothetical protein
VKSAEPDDIIAGAKRYASQRQGQEARYTKNPATWLNAGAWLDEPQAAGYQGYRNPDDASVYEEDLRP